MESISVWMPLTVAAAFALIAVGGFWLVVGDVHFWRLVSSHPDAALFWFKKNPAWVLSQRRPGAGWLGFRLALRDRPELRVWVRRWGYRASQRQFETFVDATGG